jgi:DNA-binding winged helix-turn-helix (wHTH) protein
VLFRFDGYRLNTGDLRLEKEGAPPGAVPPLSQLEFRLLRRLLEAAPDVVAKESLFGDLWPDEPFTVKDSLEARLHGLVKSLRNRLGDDAASPRYIETLKGTGYRMRAAVSRAPAGTGRRWRLWSGAGVAAVAGVAGLWTLGGGRGARPAAGPSAPPATLAPAPPPAVRLVFVPDPPLRPGMLEVGGTHEGLSSHDHVWILLSDAYGNWYPQFPPAEIRADGTWVARNVSVGPGITTMTAVLADDAAEGWLRERAARSMATRDWSALKQLPGGLVTLARLPR